MAHKIYIGIDNGTTGSIAWISPKETRMIETPIWKEQSYTKAKNIITRIDHLRLMQVFEEVRGGESDIIAVIERPMINPMRFKASVSAARSLESTLCILEVLGIARMYVDSRDWQKKMLPKGCEGKELKTASMDIGCRLFPSVEKVIKHHKDADSLLIAEWARREGL